MSGTEPMAPAAPRGDEIDLRAILRILRRRRWVALGVLVTTLLLGIAVTARSPKIYRATAKLLIEQQPPQVLAEVREVYNLGSSNYWITQEYLNTQYGVIQSEPVLRRALAAIGLNPHTLAETLQQAGEMSLTEVAAGDSLGGVPKNVADKVSLFGFDSLEHRDKVIEALRGLDIIRWARGVLRIDPVRDSRLVDVSVELRHPEFAALFANALADAYTEFNLDQKVEATESAVSWLSSQTADLKERLTASELQLYEFKKANNIVSASLQDLQAMAAQTLAEHTRRFGEIQAKRIELESRRDMIARVRDQKAPLDAIDQVISNLLIIELKAEYSRLRQKETDMAARYTAKHPALISIQDQVREAEATLYNEIGKILASVESEYRTQLDVERRQQERIAELQAQALDLNQREIEYNRLVRERDNNRVLYELVLKRQKETDLSQMLKVNNVRKLEAATVPELPIRPRVRLNIILSLFVGLIMGLGAAFAVDFFDNTVKSQQQIEQTLGLPFLGIIPAIKDVEASADYSSERDLYILTHPRSSTSECCRTIRTNIMLMTPEKPARVLLVTSSGPREGKSTTAINLAVTIAQSGLKTLLIDTDMRRPRLHKSFGVRGDVGLSTLILGEHTVDASLVPTQVENLSLLCAGPIPPNPVEILHTGRFAALLKELQGKFDRVIFDSPPIAAVSDALVLGSMVDGIVLVVQAGRTTWQAALESRKRILGVNGRILGVVLNNVDLQEQQGNAAYTYYEYYQPTYGEDVGDGTRA